LSRYAIDAQSGRLDKLGDQAVGQGPNWVEIVETGV
jgi:6-phosphogluconolactonase (cycloisomerase 2 family)